jgi:hypothetical protein
MLPALLGAHCEPPMKNLADGVFWVALGCLLGLSLYAVAIMPRWTLP